MSQETPEETNDEFEQEFFRDAPESNAEQAETPQDSDEQAERRARDEQGRFSKAEKAEAKNEGEQAEQPEPDDKADGAKASKSAEMVPHSVVAQLRDEIRALKAAQDQRGNQPQSNQQEQAKQAPIPDPIDDPQGFYNHVERITVQNRFAALEANARDLHGDDKVEAAQEAFREQAEKNPSLWHEFSQARSPYGYLLKWHERQAVLSEIGEDPAAYRERIRQEVLAEAQGQPVQPAGTQHKPASPPPSLARGGQGGAATEVVGEDEAFVSAFR